MSLTKHHTKRRWKLFCLCLIIILLAVNLIPSGLSVLADPPDPLAGFKIADATITLNGQPIDTIDTPIDQNATIRLAYTWSIEDTDFVHTGDSISVLVPEALQLGDTNISGELVGGGTSYGTWLLNITTRELSLSLSDVPAGESNVHGTVEFTLNFTVNEMVVSVPYELIIPLSEGLDKTYHLNFRVPGNSALVKSGVQSDSDANVLTWTVDINRTLAEVETPVITDDLDSLLDYEDDSLEIYGLTVYSNGTVTQALVPIDTSEYVVNYADHTLTVTFNAPIDRAYRLIYNTRINSDLIDTSRTTFSYANDVHFNGATKSATVNITRGPLIFKDSTPNQAFNADSITWSISVNQALYPLKNVIVEDSIPPGLTLDTGSIAVYQMPGNVLVDPANYTLDVDPVTQLTISFGDINHEYLVTYDTTVNESVKNNNNTSLNFTNSAKLYQGIEPNVQQSPTSETIALAKGRVIQKSGTPSISYNDEKYILWTVNVNQAEIDLGTDTITDVIGAGQKLNTTYGHIEGQKRDGIIVYPLTIDHDQTSNNITQGARLTEGVDYFTTLDDDDPNPINGFNIRFPDNITQPYRIVYQTVITNKTTQTFQNTAYIGPSGGTPSASASTTPTIENTYSKSSTGVNYQSKVLSWRINIDPRQQAIQNLVMTDTFTPGLMMTNDQLSGIIVQQNATTLTKDVDYTVTENVIGGKIKGFTLSFADTGHVVNNYPYTITYSTTMDPDILPNNGNLNYRNSVLFTHSGGSLTRNGVPSISNTALHNGSKSGTLDAPNKRINWIVNTNYLSKNIQNFEVSDTIAGNQRLVQNSVQIFNYTIIAGETITEGTQVDTAAAGITIEEDPEGKSFRVIFPANISTPYRIKYATEFIGISQTVYSNTAATNVNENYTATVNYADGDKFVSKEGFRNGIESVDWKVTLNKSQSTISSYTLTDTLSEGLELVEDSFVIKKAADGSLVDFDTMFTLNVHERALVTEPQVFDLISKIPISETFTVEYRTNIILDEVLENKVFNNISFTGEQVVSGARQDSVVISHTFVVGSGTGTGEVGSFKLTKMDELGNPLAGAKFELYKGAKLLGVLETDTLGEITMSRLKYATYTLKEIEAPTGYQIMNQNTDIIINGTAQQNITVVNHILRTLEIIKVEKNNPTRFLRNAQFEIRDSSDVLLKTIITDNTGRATAELPYGTYKVTEKTAPSGYYKDTQEYQVVITEGDLNPDTTLKLIYSLTVENTKRSGGGGGGGGGGVPTVPPPSEPPKTDTTPETITVETPEETPLEGKIETPESSLPEIIDTPKNGKVKLEDDGKWVYTPDAEFTGEDSFTVIMNHGDGSIDQHTINIRVVKGTVEELPKTGQEWPWIPTVAGGLAVCIGISLLWDEKRMKKR